MNRPASARLANPTVSVRDILDRVTTFVAKSLQDGSVELCNDKGLPARTRSSVDQTTISKALMHFTHASDWFQERQLALDIPAHDHWYDFAITGRDLFLPVNLKVSTMRGRDNVSAKDGLFYALTGEDPRKCGTNSWERFFSALAKNLSASTSADYFFRGFGFFGGRRLI